MRKLSTIVTLLTAAFLISANSGSPTQPSDDKQEIEKIESLLTSQDAAWNKGDIESFMTTYWKSDQMTFSGGGTTRRGWDATLAQYKKSYPTQKEMGKLHFDELETTLLGDEVALVLGNWHLELANKKRDGNFSLVMRKIDGQWKIVHDHSSELEKEKGWLTLAQAKQVARCKIGIMQEKLIMDIQDHFIKVYPGRKLQSDVDRSTVWVNRMTGMIHATKPDGWKE